MKIARLSSVAVAVCLMAGLASAQPGGERQGGGRGQGQRGGLMMLVADPPLKRLADGIAKLDLTSEQKEKIEALKKEYEPKFKEIHENMEKILTDDQKKIVADAKQKAKDATGPERFQKINEALADVKLTDEQKEKMRDVGKEFNDTMTEARPKFMEVLTDEQKEKLRAMMPRNGRGPRGGNPDNKPKEKEST